MHAPVKLYIKSLLLGLRISMRAYVTNISRLDWILSRAYRAIDFGGLMHPWYYSTGIHIKLKILLPDQF